MGSGGASGSSGGALERITFRPGVMGGRACVRGLRISVSLVVRLVASGMTVESILDEYPDLEAEDVAACLEYAAWLASEETVPRGDPAA